MPPPPAPTASTWTDTVTRPTQTMYGGDDIVIAGTDLDTVTTVTIGGFSQPFIADSPTQITAHVSDTARDGHVVVSNSSGSATARNNSSTFAAVRFLGPWTYPPDQTATDQPSFTDQMSHISSGQTISPTQPDATGSPFAGGSGAVTNNVIGDSDGGDPSWYFTGAVVVLDERPWNTPNTMPNYTPSAEMAADPTVVDYETDTADHPTKTSDLTITFHPVISASDAYLEDSNGRTISDDLYQQHVQYRRLDASEWEFLSFRPYLVGTWPAGVAGKPLDFDRLVTHPADTLFFDSIAPWTDNRSFLGSTHDYGFTGPLTVSWDDFGETRAWIVAFSNWIDGPPLTPPVVDPDPLNRTGSQKLMNVTPFLRGQWQYRPRRYRLIYTAPPPVITTRTLRRRQQAARTGSAPRRRQVAARSSSPRRGPGAAP